MGLTMTSAMRGYLRGGWNTYKLNSSETSLSRLEASVLNIPVIVLYIMGSSLVQFLEVDQLLQDVADEGMSIVPVLDLIADSDDVTALLDEILQIVVGAFVSQLSQPNSRY
jgi:hypothetical protein